MKTSEGQRIIWEDALQITKEKFVFLNPQLSSELRATQRGRENYHFARETFYPQRYGVACNKGAPFLPKLNQMWV